MGPLSAAPARALLVSALLLPSTVAAGPTLGLRLGWASALGGAADHLPMSEAVAWQVPIQADALFTSGRLAAGAYGSWGVGGAGAGAQGCSDGATCSAQAIRAGAQALWSFRRPATGVLPWAGAGLGWEWASHRRERLGAATTTRWNGPELSIQGGAEWRLGGRFAVGPFALVGLGRYSGLQVETSVESASAPVADRAVHAWIHLGVRGTIDL